MCCHRGLLTWVTPVCEHVVVGVVGERGEFLFSSRNELTFPSYVRFVEKKRYFFY